MTPGALYRWTDEAAIRTFVTQDDAPGHAHKARVAFNPPWASGKRRGTMI
ncbi:hypothetical protein [Sphingobium sp. KCTC 72723]|nr:hypothetical protein [Sphingobium sp. KCTC 72723]